MSCSDIEHFATIISGCESLTSGDLDNSNARYAFSVLKLHAQDEGFIAGKEGFADAVKKGAQALSKWIKALINAILDFCISGRKEARLAQAESERKEREFVEKQKLESERLRKDLKHSEERVKKLEADFEAKIKRRDERLASEAVKYTSKLEEALELVKSNNSAVIKEFEENNISNPPELTKCVRAIEKAIILSKKGDMTRTLAATYDIGIELYNDLDTIKEHLTKLLSKGDEVAKEAKLLSSLSDKYFKVSVGVNKLTDIIKEHKDNIWEDKE